MLLSELNTNEFGIISKVKGSGAFRRRITEMGFVKGKKVIVVKNAPLKDPIQYNILGYEISLRRNEAALIEVVSKHDELPKLNGFTGTITEEHLRTSATEKGKEINVVFVGNPNAGKTSLFNFASNSKEHVGNYTGVTVSSKTATIKHNGYTFNITDLPGTYSLSVYSPEELFVRDFIIDEIPDIVVNVVDTSNLERNLYLTTQLIDMDIKVVVALNMFDEFQKKGDTFDYISLGKMLGIPFVPTVGSKGRGINELLDKIISIYDDKEPYQRHVSINYGDDVEKSIQKIRTEIKENNKITYKLSSRFLALKLLEKDHHIKDKLLNLPNYKVIREDSKKEIEKLENVFQEDSETIITDAKYGFIAGALKETYKEGTITKRKTTEILDTFLTHKLFGFPVFFFLLWLMFQSTFTLGSYPMDWIDNGVLLLGSYISKIMPDGSLKDLIVDGVIGGVGGVIVFLPNILILFFFISLMEDTGYMARAAFIMDKIMHKIGLHGKSFIPLIMGFGCNVPAIMATRTIEDKNNRILTILINPFMSCSARLPVYILLIGAFFPKHKGSVLFLIYAIGILFAVIVALIFKKFIFTKDEQPFVMELPPYRLPSFRTTTKHMWSKASQYLRKMGGVILVASVIIWALENYPKNINYSKDYDSQIAMLEESIKTLPEGEKVEVTNKINVLKFDKSNESQSNSYLARIGKTIEPALTPLGFDWRMGVSLLSGIAAKEIVISTLGVIFQVGEDEPGSIEPLADRLRHATYTSGNKQGEKLFTPLAAFSYIMFILIYFPCVAVIAAIKKETDTWKWALFTIFYTTGLAWLISFVVYQTGSLFL